MAKTTAECIACLSDIREQSEKVHSEISQRANDQFELYDGKITAFLEKQEIKNNETRSFLVSTVKWFLSIALGFLVVMAGGVGYYAIQIEKKADKNATLSIEDAKIIRELGDKYYDSRYVHADGSTVDQGNYQLMLQTLFERASRGGIKANQ